MRKRILFCLAALLFVSGAFAQTKPWDAAVAAIPGTVKGSDTVYICLPQTKPLELGTDVLKHYLPMTKGDWAIIYPASTPSYPGLNVFVVDGAQAGTYVFTYTVTETMCSVAVGEVFTAYVVLVPDMQNVRKDTMVCKNMDASLSSASEIQKRLPTALQDFLNYWCSNVTYNPTSIAIDATHPDSNPGGNNTSSTGTILDTVDVALTPVNYSPSKYTCKLGFNFVYGVKVVDSIRVTPVVDTLLACEDDIKSWTPVRPSDHFAGFIMAGSWTAIPNVIGGDGKIDFASMTLTAGHAAGGTTGTGPFYTFTFTYSDCDGTNLTAKRVIKVIAADPAINNLGKDSTSFCKQPPYDSIKLYEHFHSGMLVPYASGLTWKYVGNNYDGTGTTAATPMADGKLQGEYTSEYYVDKSLIGTGVPYYFRFKFGPSISCMANDTGTVVVMGILPTGGVFQHSRVSLCKMDGIDFNMNSYLSLSSTTQWSNVAPGSAPPHVDGTGAFPSGVFGVAEQDLGVYTFRYYEATQTGCGGAREGDLYVKVTDKVAYSEVTNVYFCRDILPTVVNLFELIGIAPVSGTWTAVPAYAPLAGNTVTMANLASQPDGTHTYIFTPDSNSNCVTSTLTVNITLGSTLP